MKRQAQRTLMGSRILIWWVIDGRASPHIDWAAALGEEGGSVEAAVALMRTSHPSPPATTDLSGSSVRPLGWGQGRALTRRYREADTAPRLRCPHWRRWNKAKRMTTSKGAQLFILIFLFFFTSSYARARPSQLSRKCNLNTVSKKKV
jgi:hypothetical protein